jgi:protein CpxP
MKKLIFTALLFISMGSMAFAQQKADHKKEHKTPEEKAQHQTDKLDKELTLTADQKSKIYTINLNGIKEAKKNHVKGQKVDPSVKKLEMEKTDGQISALLNAKQRKAYQELKIEKNNKKQEKKDHHKDAKKA